MEFELTSAVRAGTLAAAAMTALTIGLRLSRATGIDMLLIQGSVFTRNPFVARLVGAVTHIVVMGGVVFGTTYALLLDALGAEPGQAWWYGAALGTMHGLAAGALMPCMPYLHPHMQDVDPEEDLTISRDGPHELDIRGGGSPEQSTASMIEEQLEAHSTVATQTPELEVRAPGFFGRRYGALTPGLLFLAHVVYGVVFAVAYDTFI